MFVERMKDINPSLEILGEYVTAKTPIKYRCKICGYIGTSRPNNLSNGAGCAKCGHIRSNNAKRKTHDVFIRQLEEKFPYIECLGTYKGAKDNLPFVCHQCGCKYETTPDSILQSKYGCPNCANKSANKDRIKSHEQFCNELKLVNPSLIPLEEYKTDHTKIKMYCAIHDYAWHASPNKLLHKSVGCPKCTQSKGEKVVSSILDEWSINYTPQYRFDDCKDKNTLPFDFYLYDDNVCIEYDGQQHYMDVAQRKSLEYTQRHDEIKDKYCKDNKIGIIRIPYWEEDVRYFLFDNLVKHNVIQEIQYPA